MQSSLYHGSPFKLGILKPVQGRGIDRFENIKAVFLVKTLNEAKLYAIGKTLKGKTAFAVVKGKLVLAGKAKPGDGYVYEVEVMNPIKGMFGQYSKKEKLKPNKVISVSHQECADKIVRVKDVLGIVEYIRKHDIAFRNWLDKTVAAAEKKHSIKWQSTTSPNIYRHNKQHQPLLEKEYTAKAQEKKTGVKHQS